MTWYLTRDDDTKTYYAIWSEEVPGHHKIFLKFDLEELKQQLHLTEAPIPKGQ